MALEILRWRPTCDCRPLRHALRACGVGAGPSGRADRVASSRI